MADGTTTIKACCLCGAANHQITFATSDLPLKQKICHCHSCRHISGTLNLTLINLPSTYMPSPALVSKLAAFPSSDRLTQYFCLTCGTQLLSHNWTDASDHSKGSHWEAMTGTLEQAEGIFEPALHEFVEDTLDGGFADFLPTFRDRDVPRWAAGPEKSDKLPLHWQSPENAGLRPSSSDKLHAHCKCGGVEFWIVRPSARSKGAFSPIADLLVPDHLNRPEPEPSAWWLRDGDTKFLAGVCYCNSCRLDTGMEWMEWAFIPTVDITLDKDGQIPFELPFGSLKAFSSSRGVVRYHCGECGASVFFTSDRRDGLVDVAVGVLDAVEGARANSWLEFETGRLSFREDGVLRARSLTVAVEDGLLGFGRSGKE